MDTKSRRFKEGTPDFYKDFSEEELYIMRIRCRASGCQYGIEGIDKEPKDHCVWCGERRVVGHFYGISIADLLEDRKRVKEMIVPKEVLESISRFKKDKDIGVLTMSAKSLEWCNQHHKDLCNLLAEKDE